MNRDKEISALLERYCDLIGPFHHKDRDCHWVVNKQWSYGKPPVYIVEHHGYLYDFEDGEGIRDFSDEFSTYREAEDFLVSELRKAIAQVEKWDPKEDW